MTGIYDMKHYQGQCLCYQPKPKDVNNCFIIYLIKRQIEHVGSFRRNNDQFFFPFAEKPLKHLCLKPFRTVYVDISSLYSKMVVQYCFGMPN